MRIFFLCILLIFVTCKGQKKSAEHSQDASANETIQLLVQDDYSGAEAPESLVIKNNKELRAFYAKINRTRKPGLAIPEVDFAEEMIIVHCSGERGDGAVPTLSLSNVTEDEMVFVAKNKDSDSKTTAITSPFSLYKIPLTDKKIVFEIRQK